LRPDLSRIVGDAAADDSTQIRQQPYIVYSMPLTTEQSVQFGRDGRLNAQ
jgi:hypothetical protein